VFHPDYPAQRAWGFEGNTAEGPMLNPTIFARYGRPVICRLFNELPQDHVGFGTPEVSMHLHNLHSPSESDGFPGDYFSASKAGPTMGAPGSFKDHFYPNVYAGLEEFGDIGDPRQALGTLWYHDHTLDFTAPNASRGLAGFYLLFDHIDSGDERDRTPGALRLPSHPYDYPLMLQDKRFDADGIHVYDQMNPEGTLGDKVTVNGKIEPVLRVANRKYRLRLLNAGPTRFYELYVVTADNKAQPFRYIGNDGNLLPAPITMKSVRLGIAERADIVVNFARYPVGTELYLVNRLRQFSTRKPDDLRWPGTKVLKVIVDRSANDRSRVPAALRELPPLDPLEIAAAPVRRWVFARKNGMWTVNDRLMDVHSPSAAIVKGSAEVWELVNPSGGWAHPIHIHFEEGRILSKAVDGIEVPIPPHEQGRKDVFVLEKSMTIRVFLRFRDFTGKYVMHCHNLPHEDHAMMLRFDVTAA
jgi:FtsP/CotA-like multicopper oxidase with cupredoxin domain